MTHLPRNVSLYLDLLRIGAALAVFLCHAHYFLFPGVYFPLLFNHGREAVAVFFVLSGFVIQYTVLRSETHWRDYISARILRIFPVALIALTVTLVCDRIGQGLNPAFYGHLYQTYHFDSSHSLLTALRNLSFTNEIWSANSVFGTNEPYWSLGFEVWYYILFGLFTFLPRPWRLAGLCLAGVICGPKILLYFPLWLIGTLACRQIMAGNIRLSSSHSIILLLASVAGYLCVWSWFYAKATTMYASYAQWQEAINAGYFAFIAVATYGVILSLHGLTENRLVFNERGAGTIRWIAGATFTLYLTHQPLLLLSAAIVAPAPSYLMATSACGAVLLAVLGLAELGERRKSLFKGMFSSMARPRKALTHS